MPHKDIFSNPNRGPLGEWVLKHILNSWKQSKRILDAVQLQELDSKGIDLLVMLRGGLAVIVQVKTSDRHVKKHHARYPAVKFLYIVKNFPRHRDDLEIIEIVEEDFRKEINDFVESAFKELANGSKKIRAVR